MPTLIAQEARTMSIGIMGKKAKHLNPTLVVFFT